MYGPEELAAVEPALVVEHSLEEVSLRGCAW
jgi:hypothetical protein